VPEGKTDSHCQAGRLSLQGMWRCVEEKEEIVLAEEGQRVICVETTFFSSFYCACQLLNCAQVDFLIQNSAPSGRWCALTGCKTSGLQCVPLAQRDEFWALSG
jgi:hypothetical protein